MNCSVVTHHNTAWCRSQRATSRCTPGSCFRLRSRRRGKGVPGTPGATLVSSVLHLQPDQEAVGQHHRGGGSPARVCPGTGPSPTPLWPPHGTVRWHGGDGHTPPASPAEYRLAGCSSSTCAPRAGRSPRSQPSCGTPLRVRRQRMVHHQPLGTAARS